MLEKYWPHEIYYDAPSFMLNTLEWCKLYPNFTPAELASDNGHVRILKKALVALQLMRLDLGLPLTINSAYRCPAHNERVGGKQFSMHVYGHAFDISLACPSGGVHCGFKLEGLAKKHGFNGIGRYPRREKPGWIHIDMRDRGAVWGPKDWLPQ